MSCLDRYLVPSSLACHVFFMLCSIFFKVFCFFVWASFSHSSCTPHASYPCSYLLFFPSFLLIHLSIHEKNGESIPECIPKCFIISIWLMCTFSGGEILSRAHLLIPYFVRLQFAFRTPKNPEISFSPHGAARTSKTAWLDPFGHRSTQSAFLS